MNRLVSVIIPVYNVKNYLDRCIKSVLSQSYRALEILLIDDGSTDGSGTICDEFVEADGRVTCYHIQNKGVSNARNIGLNKSTGDFVTFIDADDVVEKDFIYTLINYQQKNDYDIVISNAIDFNECIEEKNVRESRKTIALDKNQSVREFLKGTLFRSVCWGRLYKRDIINNIRFNTGMKIAEDGEFFLKAIDNSQKMLFINEKKYYYYKRIGSAMNCGFNNDYYDEIKFCDLLIERFNENPDLLRLALLKKFNFISRCLLMQNISNLDKTKLLKNYNEVYKRIKRKKLKTIIKYKIISCEKTKLFYKKISNYEL